MNESLVIWRCISQYCFDDKTKRKKRKMSWVFIFTTFESFYLFRLFLWDADIILLDEINFSRSEILMKKLFV